MALGRSAPGESQAFEELAAAYIQDYELQGYRTTDSTRGRVANLKSFFGGLRTDEITPAKIREYQSVRRQDGTAGSTINRETSGLSRMFRLAIEFDRLTEMPRFPKRLQENPPRQGFFEHHEYLSVRA